MFSGDLDRNISAYDADTGEALWSIRLDDAPVASPVTYLLDDKQYLAVTAGRGIIATARGSLTPEIKLPMKPAATLWIFELP